VSDKRLAVAWYFALKDTVVAADLDQASRIAYGADKRFARVVTLEGALIEPSGTMSGGGGRPKVSDPAVLLSPLHCHRATLGCHCPPCCPGGCHCPG
jgi:chromosome segregation ATPase